MTISFMPLSDDNVEVAMAAYASTRDAELALVNWTAEQKDFFIRMQFTAQQQDYQRRFPDAQHFIIEVDGQAAGRLYVVRLDDSIRLLDLTILPAHRKHGIGTRILKDFMSEAQAAGKAVRIYVESFNPSLALFERLGFVPSEELGVHLLMEWRAAQEAPHDAPIA
ncbi:MAG: GNAT family N-acetyltransferase [Acidobacteria bacterium]|nr:GNAT family N-acetyltransferase [Acidobacteriota bacterium]